MAFNPFSNFQKYRRFWMAAVLLVCMVTFVFCSGMAGVENFIIGLLVPRQSTTIAVMDGTNVTREQLKALEQQRKIASQYMRQLTQMSYDNVKAQWDEIEKKLRDPQEKDQKKQAELIQEAQQTQYVMAVLKNRLKQKDYFGTGTDLEDLLDFMLWQKQADRLGIYLSQSQVDFEVLRELPPERTLLNRDQLAMAQYEVLQNSSYGVSSASDLREALAEEFRVRLAQIALMQAMQQTRTSLAPQELWRTYQEKLGAFDVALLPIKVESFVDKTEQPSDIQLEALFNQYKKERYDPSSDRPGFVMPERIKVSYLTIDPKSDAMKKLAERGLMLQNQPPVLIPDTWNPVLMGLGATLRLAGANVINDAMLQQTYNVEKNSPDNSEKYEIPYPFLDPVVYPFKVRINQLAASIPLAAASINPLGSLQIFDYANRYFKYDPKVIDAAIADEVQRRSPLLDKIRQQSTLASLVVQNSATQPLFATAYAAPFEKTWDLAQLREPAYLPFPLVRNEMEEVRNLTLAEAWVRDIMSDIYKYIQDNNASGRGPAMFKALGDMRAKYKDRGIELQVHDSTGYRDRFDIEQDKALEPLKKSFEDAYDLLKRLRGDQFNEEAFKKTDFARIFFDSSVPFSLATTSENYVAKRWPPEIKLPTKGGMAGLAGMEEGDKKGEEQAFATWQLSDQPILFWRTAKQDTLFPKTLDQVRPEVERAWRLQRAREQFALKKAAEIAEDLKKHQLEVNSYLPILQEKAKELDVNLIRLERVSPWQQVTEEQAGQVIAGYLPYKLPEGIIPYPRSDTAEQILALNDLDNPIQTVDKTASDAPGGDPALDELNKTLFRKDLNELNRQFQLNGDPTASQIQVLTNKPRTVYYVAVVTGHHPRSVLEFSYAYMLAAGQQTRDQFVIQAHIDAGKQFRNELTKQLRDEADLNITNREAWE